MPHMRRAVALLKRGASRNSCARLSKTSINRHQPGPQRRPKGGVHVIGMFTRTCLLIIAASALCAVGVSPQTPRSAPITVGEIAPDFALGDHHGQKHSLSESRSRRPVVLVFYRGYWFFQAEDGIRDADVTGVQTCALPI